MDIVKRLADIKKALAGTPGADLLHVATVDPEDNEYLLIGSERVHVDDFDLWLFDHEITDERPVIVLDR